MSGRLPQRADFHTCDFLGSRASRKRKRFRREDDGAEIMLLTPRPQSIRSVAPLNQHEYKSSSQAPSILQALRSARRDSGGFFNALLLSFPLNLFFSLPQRDSSVSHSRDQLSPICNQKRKKKIPFSLPQSPCLSLSPASPHICLPLFFSCIHTLGPIVPARFPGRCR